VASTSSRSITSSAVIASTSGDSLAVVARAGSYRWVICALLFVATTINYIDRQVVSLLGPTLSAQFGWSELDYSYIIFNFSLAYAIGLLVVGRVIDRLGTKSGFSIAIVFWSFAAIAHAFGHLYTGPAIPSLSLDAKTGFALVTLAGSVAGFSLARFALGLGEAGNFPASIKAVAEWFPKRERALATGIFNSGTNVGALVAPLAVPWITLTWGWDWTFILTGLLGFAWLAAWWLMYDVPRRHPRLSPQELAYIESDPIEPVTPIAWARLVPHRQTWAFAVGKFLTDPIWWLYLYWVPDFLHRVHHIDLKGSALPIFVIYQIATVGSIGGGWLPAYLLGRGWSVNAARKTAMLVPALCVLPIMAAPIVSNMWLAVILIGIAASAHQAWSANIFTFSSDMFPKRAIGSVVGMGGMAGAIGGMLIALVVGQVLQRTGSYVPIFIMAGCAYLLALGIIHLLVPTIAQVNLDDQTPSA
jgi:MFS transporter, ACS family, aldohexuronate transporter